MHIIVIIIIIIIIIIISSSSSSSSSCIIIWARWPCAGTWRSTSPSSTRASGRRAMPTQYGRVQYSIVLHREVLQYIIFSIVYYIIV